MVKFSESQQIVAKDKYNVFYRKSIPSEKNEGDKIGDVLEEKKIKSYKKQSEQRICIKKVGMKYKRI